MFICKVNSFSTGNPDKNDKMPVYLECKNGSLPERARVLNGTIAERLNIAVDKIYAFEVTYTGDGDYGPQYRHTILSPVSIVEYAQMQSAGFPKTQLLFDVKAPVNANPVVVTAEGDEADF